MYTLAKQQPLLLGAALTNETAEWMGSWAEGLLTAHKPIDELKEIIYAFKKGVVQESLCICKSSLVMVKMKKN